MARPVIKFDQKHCAECGIRMPPVAFKRPFAKMCHDCRGDNRSDNQELKDIRHKTQALQEHTGTSVEVHGVMV